MINLTKPPMHLVIGRQGENQYRPQEFDISGWLAQYPDGAVSIVFVRPDGEKYPVVVNAIASPAVWTPSAADTAVSGYGKLELRISSGEVLGKSVVIQTITAPSINGEGAAPPTPAPDWMQEVAENADAAEKSADRAERERIDAELAKTGAVDAKTEAEAAQAAAESARDAAAGRAISSVARTSGTGAPGTIDTYTITFNDGTATTFDIYNGANGLDGAKGDKGDSPIKGIDYWTESDKMEIIQAVVDIMGGVLIGYVDENNVIVLVGGLEGETYTVKYKMENESLIDIGELDLVVKHSVTNNLTNCTNSNDSTEVVTGDSYTATITAGEGYYLSSLIVTMGGTDITSSAVSGGTISIASVTGNIVITAETEANRTNFADPASADWIIGGRISNSATNGIALDAPSAVVTNYIHVEAGDVLYFEGCDLNTTVLSSARYAVYTGTTHDTRVYNESLPTTSDGYVVKLSGNEVEIVSNDINYFRMTVVPDTDSSAIIINIKRNDEWL